MSRRPLRISALSALKSIFNAEDAEKRRERGTCPIITPLLESGFVTWVIFLFLIGSSGRPSHESNYYSILYFVIAGPHHAGARRRRSYRIRSTEVTILVNRKS